ncbi:MAG: polysaccharide biosynthesis/export family protein [Terriglobia bacterium]
MSTRDSRTAEVGMRRRRLPIKIALALVLGAVVISLPANLKAQNPAQAPDAGATGQERPRVPPAPSGSSSDEYLINPGDVLEIYVYDVPELTHSYTVSLSGSVTVPLLPNPVAAAGLTSDQFAHTLAEAFRQSGRLQRPEIAVTVTKPSITESVAVEGAVKNPLILPAIGRTRLVDILTQCGGLTDDAGTNVTITRGPLAMRDLAAEGGVATPTLTIELKKVMDVTDPASTITVWPGDRVSVSRAQPDVYYVMGEVGRPGGYTLRNGHEELTVLRALALAGDATGVAKTSKAMIIRKDSKGPQGREEIKLDLKKILLGKSPDPNLQADDILFVPGSNGKKALRTIEGAPGYIVGAAGTTAIVTH